ncbi:transporter substrate-binding domain-containing protein [Shewanella sp. VB17]|uniref:substrate-binding periplasmic protein n=1 Tax=Shewanella sp. VB17 TaxID=2739432 RepID=UPI00156587D3|nr:ABC transporter substrate-binding protein [Shewanella sp. VB17]NRD74799.1 transporter substrate-binding domain-containing protein [Shewanella sp. VB17]
MVICSLSIVPLSPAEEVIHLANGEWRPFVSEELKYGGVFSRIVSDAFALKGVRVVYHFMPWKRGEVKSREGQIDGSIGYGMFDKFKQDFYYSDTIFSGSKVFFHLKSEPFDWNTYDDLNGITMGAVIGFNFGAVFDKAEKSGQIQVTRIENLERLFKMLIKKRITVIPLTVEIGYDVMNNKLFSEEAQLITHHSKPFFNTTFHMILTKKIAKNKDMLKRFNEGLQELKDSGNYDKYVAESLRGGYIIK